MPQLPQIFELLVVSGYYAVQTIAIVACVINFAIALLILMGYALMGNDSPDPTFNK